MDPLPTDAVVLIARFPERPPVRIATKRRVSGSVVDVGRIVVERGGDLTIRLRNLTEEVPPEESLGVELGLTRPDPGSGGDAPPLLGSVSAARPLILRDVLPGSWRASLRWRDVKLGEREIDVLPGRTDYAWDLVDRSIGGRVESETGDAISGARVRLENGLETTVDTDADGRFALTFPHAGGRIPFSVLAGEQGRRLPRIVDPESVEALAVTIRVPSRSMDVTILDAVTRKPIERSYLTVEIVPKEAPDGLSKISSRREALNGLVRLSELPEGTVRFEAYAPRYSKGERREVILSKDARPAPVEVLLHKADRVAGVVVDPDGRPRPGARVAGPHGGGVQEVQSAADGSFELEIPAAQSSVVSVWATGYRIGFVSLTPGSESVTVALQRRGPDSEAEIRLDSGEPFGRAGWQLYVGAVPIDPYQLRDAFLGSGCIYVPGTSSDGVLPLPGCLAEGVYSIGLTRVVEGKAVSVRTDAFRAGQTGVVRLKAYQVVSP